MKIYVIFWDVYEFELEWNYSFLPRVGEYLSLEDFMSNSDKIINLSRWMRSTLEKETEGHDVTTILEFLKSKRYNDLEDFVSNYKSIITTNGFDPEEYFKDVLECFDIFLSNIEIDTFIKKIGWFLNKEGEPYLQIFIDIEDCYK